MHCTTHVLTVILAGPVIQATAQGGRNLRMVFWSGDFVSGYLYHLSVCTGLPDQTKQTKFQSQRPSKVKTPVPSIWSTELKQHRDSQYLDG
jgi:hypothetical protein